MSNSAENANNGNAESKDANTARRNRRGGNRRGGKHRGGNNRNRRPTTSGRILGSFFYSLVFLIIGILVIIGYLSFKYQTYDYNIPMRLLAVVPGVVGAILISVHYFLFFNQKVTKNDITYLRRTWKSESFKLFLVMFVLEITVSVMMGLFLDRNGNMLRFLLDGSYSGLLVFGVNIVSGLVVLLVQRRPHTSGCRGGRRHGH